jgi:hypothetical protein
MPASTFFFFFDAQAVGGGDTTPPTQPESLQILSLASGSLTLQWTENQDDTTRYLVYRGVLADHSDLALVHTVLVTDTPPNGWTNTGLTNGTTYYYAVTSKDAAGNESAPTYGNGTPAPSPVTIGTLVATPDNGEVMLSWGAASQGYDPYSYEVYRGLTADLVSSGLATGELIATVAGTSYTDTTAENATLYYYAVRVVDSSGGHDLTNQVSATPVDPASLSNGYYAKHVKMQDIAGPLNLAIYSALDGDATTEDQAVLQFAMDATDRYVDGLARTYQLTTVTPHMIAEDDADFGEISDLASEIAVAKVYRARGITGDAQSSIEGQMADMDKRAVERLREIFKTRADADSVTTNDPGAFQFVPITRSVVAFDEYADGVN